MKHAIIRINGGGRTSLLCNKCFNTIREDFDYFEIEDTQHLCQKCEANQNFFVRGINWRP